ncbi:hypothetical protein A374_06101 [Fictibacillus macauensis ZFHKF-1]|uniref:Uncharacterized protein n=1 Tax=Fictibacillus macauensis ZFHKF-1 TaxID=1196324 RepID=I8UH60_9BACL|nr:hypothetical protein [Fictibacillus macauensis]EIT86148.1 hypothetical protein A374_06101 [Fictibacillus macauensis ZFHKF-1]
MKRCKNVLLNQLQMLLLHWKVMLICCALLGIYLHYLVQFERKHAEVFHTMELMNIVQNRYFYLFMWVPLALLHFSTYRMPTTSEIVAWQKRNYGLLAGLLQGCFIIMMNLIFVWSVVYILSDPYMNDAYDFSRLLPLSLFIFFGFLTVYLVWLAIWVATNSRILAFILAFSITVVDLTVCPIFSLHTFTVSLEERWFSFFLIIGIDGCLLALCYELFTRKDYVS